MQKRWKLKEVDETKRHLLTESLKIHPVLCQLLISRGIDNFEEARKFFRPCLSQLIDPWKMKDMSSAVECLLEKVKNKERILIFGDYDVDGTSSVALMYLFLSRIYDRNLIDFYIPHRQREGYGISKAGIEFAKENNFGLIISVDCGIKSIGLVTEAREAGIDFIICDHHLPDQKLPPATAILNPKQKDCNYPYKELCGCGVAFKFVEAVCNKLSLSNEFYLDLLDLVAMAIASDIVPITGENRILCFLGLKKINENPNHGIRALMVLSKLQLPVSVSTLVFTVAPRINAAGRMDDARKAVQMFVASDYDHALKFAGQLHADNSERKETDAAITGEALMLIEKEADYLEKRSTVLYQAHWHKGVVGIVASRLIEKYYRPTVVLTKSGDYASGSARSVPGFNLYEAIHACREHLIGYGGHFAAAGMTLSIEEVDRFKEKFEQVVSETIEPHLLIPELSCDAIARFTDIDFQFYRIIEQMEPFGPDNNKPVFISESVVETGYSRILKEKHLQLHLRQDEKICSGIAFNMTDKWPLIQSGKPLDIAYSLDLNEWNGEKKLQLRILDIREHIKN